MWISATFKSNRYNQWKERTKAAENEADSDDDTNNNKNEGKTNFKLLKVMYVSFLL